MTVRRPRPGGQDRDGQAQPGDRPRCHLAPGRRQLRRLPGPWRASLARSIRSTSSTRSTRRASRDRRRRRSRSSTLSGDAPDIHCLPVGNAGNITAYWKGYREYVVGHGISRVSLTARRRNDRRCGASKRPAPHRLCSAIRSTSPRPSRPPSASAIPRPGRRRRRRAMPPGGGSRPSPTSRSLQAHRLLSSTEGIFVEPASAASVAGLLQVHAAGGRARRRDDRLHGHGTWLEGSRLGSQGIVDGEPDRAHAGIPVDAVQRRWSRLGLDG
jgi:threonine synthase